MGISVEYIKQNYLKDIIITLCGIFFFSLGIGLMCTSSTLKQNYNIIEYSNITKCSGSSDESNLTCPEYQKLKNYTDCVCYKYLNITEEYDMSPVRLYYELDSFNYNEIANSRDNEQLSGHLSQTVSPACGSYSYNVTNRKAIAPCGALADFMFNDNYYFKFNGTQLVKTAGILSVEDKAMYHNPPQLNTAFNNFSKPLNWSDSFWNEFICNTDTSSQIVNSSCAFENEIFIGWMTPSMKWKPYAVLPGGLKKGMYKLQIMLNYPYSRYSGARNLILSWPDTIIFDSVKYGWGISMLVIGLLLFGLEIVLIYNHIKGTKKESSKRNDPAAATINTNRQ